MKRYFLFILFIGTGYFLSAQSVIPSFEISLNYPIPVVSNQGQFSSNYTYCNIGSPGMTARFNVRKNIQEKFFIIPGADIMLNRYVDNSIIKYYDIVGNSWHADIDIRKINLYSDISILAGYKFSEKIQIFSGVSFNILVFSLTKTHPPLNNYSPLPDKDYHIWYPNYYCKDLNISIPVGVIRDMKRLYFKYALSINTMSTMTDSYLKEYILMNELSIGLKLKKQ